MLMDTHCHLHDREFFSEKQAETALERARERGIDKIICIGTSVEDSMAARDFAMKHRGVYWTFGIHPEYTGQDKINSGVSRPRSLAPAVAGLAHFEPVVTGSGHGLETSRIDFSNSLPPIAIGEVGLDYHSEGYDREAQIKLFNEMLQLAKDNNLPLSFHVRNAFDDFFGVINNFPGIRGVVHSFTDSKKVLKRILNETDFYIGVNGLATYSTLPTPPIERILLETDAPFLTPIPFRGIINEPGYIREIAEWLSEKLALDFETIERETTKNAEQLFRF